MNFNRLKKIVFVALCFVAFSFLGGLFSCVYKNLEIGSAEKAEIQEGTGAFLFAILGGYGSIISDFVWIKAYVYWEQNDLDECISNMDLALAINPHTKMFWTFAASTLAFDSPHWIAKERGEQYLGQIERIQGRKALKYLERALEYFPKDRAILMDIATIYDIKLGDLKSAIASYKIICESEEKLVFTRRAYADLLARDGQILAAEKVLKQILGDVEVDSDIYREVSGDLAELKKIKNLL